MRYSTVLSVTLASQAINSVNLVELEEILFVSCLDNGTTFLGFSTGAGGIHQAQPLQAAIPTQPIEIDQCHQQLQLALAV